MAAENYFVFQNVFLLFWDVENGRQAVITFNVNNAKKPI